MRAEHPVGLFADRTRASDPSERRLTLVVRLKADTTYGSAFCSRL